MQWGNDLVFKVAGKMFAVACLEPGEVWLSFKCTPAIFGDLLEREGIRPAPYLARAHWVALEREDALDRRELRDLLHGAYQEVCAKLSKKERESVKGISSPAVKKNRKKSV